ncbi:MAG: hypothetical protein IBJ10_06015 [Phycisphaerales bacterium]|nr:hypothetical protein [Phycisphaerales bacterium]
MNLRRPCAAAAAILAASGALAEPATVRADLSKGRVIPLQIEYTLDAEQLSPDGAASRKRIHQSAAIRFEVTDVAEDGSAVLRGAVERLTLQWSRDDEQGEFARPRVTADVPADTPVNAALGALGAAMADASIQLVVSPDGRVEAIRGLNDVMLVLTDPAVRGEGPIPRLDASALGVFGGRQFAAMASSAFTADGAGREPRDPGETWETNESIPAPPAGSILLDTLWTTAKVEPGAATFTATPTLSLVPPPGDDPTAPRGQIAEQTGSITMVWNLAENMLDERRSEQRVVTDWSMAGMTLRQTQTSTMTIRRAD